MGAVVAGGMSLRIETHATRSGSAVGAVDVVPAAFTDVELARTGDGLGRVEQVLLPLGQPAGDATDGEQHREQWESLL